MIPQSEADAADSLAEQLDHDDEKRRVVTLALRFASEQGVLDPVQEMLAREIMDNLKEPC